MARAAERVALARRLQILERREVEGLAGIGRDRAARAEDRRLAEGRTAEGLRLDAAVLLRARTGEAEAAEVRRRSRRRAARVVGCGEGMRREIARRAEDAGTMGIFAVDREVALAIARIHAEQEARVVLVAVAVIGRRELAVDRHTLIVFLEDDVDDAGNRVRTVHGRCAAGQDFDALDHRGRDLVGVDVQRRIGGDETFAVHQNEGALGAEVAQVDRCDTGGAVVHGLGVAVVHDRRECLQRAGDAGRALQLHFVIAKGGHGAGRVDADLRNARAGHHHGFRRGVSSSGGRREAEGRGGSSTEHQGRA